MKNIVFLPGLGCDHQLFSHQIDHLNSAYTTKVVVCDSKDSMAGHIEYVLDNAPSKFDLVGHSFGGWIAQWIAIKAPERVSSLILIGTGTGKLTAELKDIFIGMKTYFEDNRANEFFDRTNPLVTHENKKNDVEVHQLIKSMQSNFTIENLLNQVNTDLEAKDTCDDLRNIKCSTLLIHGNQDAFYQEDMQFLKNHIPNNHFIEINNCGHMVPIEQPEAVSSLIKLWIEIMDSKI